MFFENFFFVKNNIKLSFLSYFLYLYFGLGIHENKLINGQMLATLSER